MNIGADEYGSSIIAERSENKPRSIEIFTYSNPFNSSCVITAPAGAEIKIYDLRGNLISTPYPAGAGFVPLDKGDRNLASDRFQGVIWQPDESVPSGIYLVRAIFNDGRVASKRIVYLK